VGAYDLDNLQGITVQRCMPDADHTDGSALVVIDEVVPEASSFGFAPVRWPCTIHTASLSTCVHAHTASFKAQRHGQQAERAVLNEHWRAWAHE